VREFKLQDLKSFPVSITTEGGKVWVNGLNGAIIRIQVEGGEVERLRKALLTGGMVDFRIREVKGKKDVKVGYFT